MTSLVNRKNRALEVSVIKKDHKKALKIIDGVLKEEPHDLDAMQVKAEILIFLKRYEESELLLKKILTMGGNKLYALNILAEIYQETKNHANLLSVEKEIFNLIVTSNKRENGKMIYLDLVKALLLNKKRKQAIRLLNHGIKEYKGAVLSFKKLKNKIIKSIK